MKKVNERGEPFLKGMNEPEEVKDSEFFPFFIGILVMICAFAYAAHSYFIPTSGQ